MTKDEAEDLIKNCPLPITYLKLIQNLHRASDKEAAVLIDGLIDQGMEIRLTSFLKGNVTLHRRRLFGLASVLSNFEAKLYISTAFGIISEELEWEISQLHTTRLLLTDPDLKCNFESVSAKQGAESSALYGLVSDEPTARRQYAQIGRIVFAVLATGSDLSQGGEGAMRKLTREER